MLNKICEKQDLKNHDVICHTEEGVFVMSHIALLAASYLSDELFYDIFNFYLVSRPAEIEKQNKKRVQEEAILLLDELGIKINQHVKWETFDIPFAYYLIKINNVVKGGIVGEKEEPKNENLDLRLSIHRSTYARFELVNVFEFRNSATVKLFEDILKHVLVMYKIGRDEDTKMEQYECPGKDTGQVINELVAQQFKAMNIETRQLGMECPKEKIDAYNKVSLKLVGSTVKDDLEDI
jgi:hypothetical protein